MISYLNKQERKFRVVVRKDQWFGPDIPCDWLGHDIYKCGHCDIGYPRVKSEMDYDDRCPECGLYVMTVRDSD
jgi:hypothetical protein